MYYSALVARSTDSSGLVEETRGECVVLCGHDVVVVALLCARVFVCVTVCLVICLFICVSVWRSLLICIRPSVCVFIGVYVYHSVCLFRRLRCLDG